MASILRIPVMTRLRIGLALAIAVIVDGMQLLMNGAGWFGPDEALDVAAMVLLTPIIGFHPLLLPTFVAEFLPVIDLLPTWTGCVLVVISLRRKRERCQPAAPPPPMPPPRDVIDV
jgi:hypothetical protein